jgi:heme/copper-type cytochrome/quinol oxidase subunit 2
MISAVSALGLLAILVVEPAAAQPWAGGGGGGQLNEFASNFIPWAMRWLITIGALVFAVAHLWASWTSNEDKSFRRKEWRNRAGFALATLIPILIVINGIIVAFGGEPLDFFPFI